MAGAVALALADIGDVLAELGRDARPIKAGLDALRTRARAARGWLVAWGTGLARWLELRVWMVRPDVRGLLAFVPVLAVGDRVTGEVLHPRHLAHPPLGFSMNQ